jgi:hypothetical protein
MLQREKTEVHINCKKRPVLWEFLLAAMAGLVAGATSPAIKKGLSYVFPSLAAQPADPLPCPPTKGGPGGGSSSGGGGSSGSGSGGGIITLPPGTGPALPPGEPGIGGGIITSPPGWLVQIYPPKGGIHAQPSPGFTPPNEPRYGAPDPDCSSGACSPMIAISGCSGSATPTKSKGLQAKAFKHIEITVATFCDSILYAWADDYGDYFSYSHQDWNNLISQPSTWAYFSAGATTFSYGVNDVYPNQWMLTDLDGTILTYTKFPHDEYCSNELLPVFECCAGQVFIRAGLSKIQIDNSDIEVAPTNTLLPDLSNIQSLTWTQWNGGMAELVANPVRITMHNWYGLNHNKVFYALYGLSCSAETIRPMLPCFFYNGREEVSASGLSLVKLIVPIPALATANDQLLVYNDSTGLAEIQDPSVPKWLDNGDGTASIWVEKKFYNLGYRLVWKCSLLCSPDAVSVSLLKAPLCLEPCWTVAIYNQCPKPTTKIAPTIAKPEIDGSVMLKSKCEGDVIFVTDPGFSLIGIEGLDFQAAKTFVGSKGYSEHYSAGSTVFNLDKFVYGHALYDNMGHFMSLDLNVAKNCPWIQFSYVTCCGGQFWTYDGEIPSQQIWYTSRSEFATGQPTWTQWDGLSMAPISQKILKWVHPSGQIYYFDQGCCDNASISGFEPDCQDYLQSPASINGYDYIEFRYPASNLNLITMPVVHIINDAGLRVQPWGAQPAIGSTLTQGMVRIFFSPAVLSTVKYIILNCHRVCVNR